VLKSGVHATLGGVVLAFFIPLSDKHNPERSPVKELEHSLHPIVAFFILPVFAFVNAGVSLQNVSFATLLQPVPLGIAAGLFIGGLAFEQTGGGDLMGDRLGVLTGSLLAGIVGYFYLRAVLPKQA